MFPIITGASRYVFFRVNSSSRVVGLIHVQLLPLNVTLDELNLSDSCIFDKKKNKIKIKSRDFSSIKSCDINLTCTLYNHTAMISSARICLTKNYLIFEKSYDTLLVSSQTIYETRRKLDVNVCVHSYCCLPQLKGRVFLVRILSASAFLLVCIPSPEPMGGFWPNLHIHITGSGERIDSILVTLTSFPSHTSTLDYQMLTQNSLSALYL